MRTPPIVAAAGLAFAGVAGWVAAQPSETARLRLDGQTLTFRPASQVRLAETPATRSELMAAKQRPAALALRRTLAQAAPDRVSLTAVDRASLPVLVSAKPALAANLRVFARADSFSASTSEPGTTLVIDGAKTAVAAPRTFRMPTTSILRLTAASTTATRPSAAARSAGATSSTARIRPEMARPATEVARPPRGTPATPAEPSPTLENVVIERVEYGIDVTFTRFGAVYNVSIECARPETDFNCTEAGAKALVGGLETIGGGEAAP